MVQCAVVMLALIIVAVNFLVDLSWGSSIPRIRVGAMSASNADELALEPARRRAGARRPGAPVRRLWRLKWGLVAAALMLVIVGGRWPPRGWRPTTRSRWTSGTAWPRRPGWPAAPPTSAGHRPGRRDLLSRVIYGGRVPSLIGVAAVLVSLHHRRAAGAGRRLLRRRRTGRS